MGSRCSTDIKIHHEMKISKTVWVVLVWELLDWWIRKGGTRRDPGIRTHYIIIKEASYVNKRERTVTQSMMSACLENN